MPKLDTTVCNEYESDIPDVDVGICLKVIRTLRNAYLESSKFNADSLLLLTHVHALIVSAYNECYVEDQLPISEWPVQNQSNKENQHAADHQQTESITTHYEHATAETITTAHYNPDQDR